MAERKHAAKQALALVVFAMDVDGSPAEMGRLLREVDDIVLVVSSLVGLVSGLLKSADDKTPGTSSAWLGGIGLSLESIHEGDS